VTQMSSTTTITKSFIVQMNRESSYKNIQNVLPTLGLKKIKILKAIAPSLISLEYKEGFFQKGKIEFWLLERKKQTCLSLTWIHPSNEQKEENNNETDFEDGLEILTTVFSNVSKLGNHSLDYNRLIEELRLKLDATEVVFDRPLSGNSSIEKAKIRCRSCLELFDETLKICPKCGTAG
jgi:hypothetical protein